MIITLLLAALQTSAWSVSPGVITVGDTVRLVRRVATEPTVRPRLGALAGDRVVEPLQSPSASYAEGTLTIVYTVAVFEPGLRGVVMPPIELLYSEGRVETFEGDTAWVEVASVLPLPDSMLQPMPLLEPLARRTSTLTPLIVLLVGVIGGTLTWGVVRHRSRARPSWSSLHAKPVEPPVERWVAAGEPRAVAAIVADRFREIIATLVPDAGRYLDIEECIEVLHRERPDWPIREVSEILHGLERARFAPAVPSDVMEVVNQAEELVVSLA